MQFAEIFSSVKNGDFIDIFNIFAQNIDCGYTLEPPQQGGSNENRLSKAVLTSTYNLCFGTKIRKIYIPL